MTEYIDIPGYEGIYQASSEGLIRSLDRIVEFKNGRRKTHKGRILSPSKDRYGYYQVILCRNVFDQRTIKVHRLIAITFLKNTKNLQQINHIDGNKLNNNVSNLEWIEGSANHRHATEKGLKAKGEKHGCSKLTDNEVRTIRRMYSRTKRRVTQKEIAKNFGISESQVNAIIHKKNWKHIKL